MKFLSFFMLPLVTASIVEQKVDMPVQQQAKQLRRNLLKKPLYDIAAPAANEVAKAVEDVNKAKEDEEFWNRLLNYEDGSMAGDDKDKEHDKECRFPGFGVC